MKKGKIKEKFLVLLLASALLFGGNGGIFGETPLQIAAAAGNNEDTNEGMPRLFIAWKSAVQEFHSGESQSLVVPILNDGNGDASQCYASFTISNPNEFPFVLDHFPTTKALTNIGSKQTVWADFGMVEVAPTAKSQLYELTLNVEYKDSFDMLHKETAPVRVRIVNEQDELRPKLAYTGVQLQGVEGDVLEAGTTAIINLCMRNESSAEARDVKIKISGFSNEGINLKQTLDTWKADRVIGDSFFMVPFAICLHEDMKSGTYPLDLEITYKGEKNQDGSEAKEFTETAKAYLMVDGESDSKDKEKEKPRLIISNYDYGNQYIKAGESFPLQMIFSNTSTEKDIQNIKVSVSSDGNVMSPVGASNTFVIPEIQQDSALEKTIVLQPVVDADTKIYNVNVAMDYQDADGNDFTAQEVIGIPVVQEIRFTLSELQLPEECFVGNPVDISLDYYNMGRTALRNLRISAEGDFDIRDNEQYIGNLDAGKSDCAYMTVVPNTSGTKDGKICFCFEDAIGNQYREEKSFVLHVKENEETMMPEDMEDFPMEMPEEAPSDTKWYVIGGIAGAAVVGGILLHRRYRRKQEEIEIDE